MFYDNIIIKHMCINDDNYTYFFNMFKNSFK